MGEEDDDQLSIPFKGSACYYFCHCCLIKFLKRYVMSGFIAARTGQLPIFVLKASENSICRVVRLDN